MFVGYPSGDKNASCHAFICNKGEAETAGRDDLIHYNENRSETADGDRIETADRNMSSLENRKISEDEFKLVLFSQGENRKGSLRKVKAIYENTYRLEPKPDQYFVWYKVRNVMRSALTPLVTNFKYDSKGAGHFCKLACTKALSVVKRKFDWPRYRFVCHATLVQMTGQGLIIADRSLWYAPTDNSAVFTYEDKEKVLVVTVHGMCLD